MRQKIFSFRLFGLDIVIEGATLLTFVGLVVVFTVVTSVLALSLFEALFAGLVLSLLHYVGSIWHHFGHAFMARRVGYPMVGITY
jgi:ABC-type uncharacterized transport system permease subunit